MSEIDELSHKMRELQASKTTVEEFHQWVTTSSDILSKVISKGILLKLKRGDISKIMSVSKEILATCSKCHPLSREQIFSNRKEHMTFSVVVDEALKTGCLRRIKKPCWYNPVSNQLGADAYFECRHCGSIWSLVEPERQFNGLWERIF